MVHQWVSLSHLHQLFETVAIQQQVFYDSHLAGLVLAFLVRFDGDALERDAAKLGPFRCSDSYGSVRTGVILNGVQR